MKRFLGRAARSGLLCALGLLYAAAGRAERRANHVFIISFDGGNPTVMQRSLMPTVMTLLRQGAGTWTAQTIFPSVTLPSHTSMLTGVSPQKHKVLWNDWKPEKGLVSVPTIFGIAKQKGLTTALFAGKPKFKHLNLPGTLDAFGIPSYSAKRVAAVAGKYILEKKPNLCFIHFADSDGAGHKNGWGSREQMLAFTDEDDALKTVVEAIQKAGIANDSVVILSADHGGHGKTHGSKSPDDMNIPWIAWGSRVKQGFAITAKTTTYDTAATALWLLDIPVPANWDGKPVASAFR